MKMHIDFRHLHAEKAIHAHGGLAKVDAILNITHSTVSQQIKRLAGTRRLRAAERVLSEFGSLLSEFVWLRDGVSGRLHIAIECYAYFEWLSGSKKNFENTCRIWTWIFVLVLLLRRYSVVKRCGSGDFFCSRRYSGRRIQTFVPVRTGVYCL